MSLPLAQLSESLQLIDTKHWTKKKRTCLLNQWKNSFKKVKDLGFSQSAGFEIKIYSEPNEKVVQIKPLDRKGSMKPPQSKMDNKNKMDRNRRQSLGANCNKSNEASSLDREAVMDC